MLRRHFKNEKRNPADGTSYNSEWLWCYFIFIEQIDDRKNRIHSETIFQNPFGF